MPVVVINVRGQGRVQLSLAGDEHPVEQFPAEGATHRSANVLARAARAGVRSTRMPSLARMASNAVVYVASRSWVRPPDVKRDRGLHGCLSRQVQRWYLRFGLSCRDVQELLAERGIEVDHVTIYRWVQRFTPLLAEAARPSRRRVGDRWCVDETYVKVGGRWCYVHRAVDQDGQVIDVYVSAKRDTAAARAFFDRALATSSTAPAEVVTDRAQVYPRLVDELFPAAWHHSERYGNNRIEADHGQLKRRLRPMRHLRNTRTATVIIAGHAFIQNLRRGHYYLTTGVPVRLRLVAAFDELRQAI